MRQIISLLLFSIITSHARADVASDLKAFLGNRAGKIVARDQAVGDQLYLFDLTTGETSKISDDINCGGALLSPDGKEVAYYQNGIVYRRTLGTSTRTKVTEGYDPHWWIDPEGDIWIYYTTQGNFPDDKRKLYWPDNKGVETYRIRLKDNKTEPVWKWKGSGGPSQDGKFIGAGYATVILYDVAAAKEHLLYNKDQGCNPSLYPGTGKPLLMFLELPHDTFCYRDTADNRLWFVNKPSETTEWQFPEWSSDPDYAMATAKETNTYYSAWVIKLSDIDGQTGNIKAGATGMLRALSTAGGHDWAEPYLWVATEQPVPDGGAAKADSGAAKADGGAGKSDTNRLPLTNERSPAQGCAVAATSSHALGLPLSLLLFLLTFKALFRRFRR